MYIYFLSAQWLGGNFFALYHVLIPKYYITGNSTFLLIPLWYNKK